MLVLSPLTMESRAPRVGHKKSRNGCAQCKRRHVKCDESKPCANCVRHGVACSLAGGPHVPRDDAKPRRSPTTPSTERTESSTAESDSLGQENRASSPIRRLLRAFDRGRNPIVLDQEWMTDLQLMHHFTSNATDLLQEPGDWVQICTQELPSLAFSTPYIMHVLLAISALHMAHAQPQRAPVLRVCAVDHIDQALTLFRQDPSPPSAENADARFCFSWMLAVFAFAAPTGESPIEAACEHIRIIQAIDAGVQETYMWISMGPFASMMNKTLQEAMGLAPDYGTVLPDGMEFGITHLDFMLGMLPMVPEERQACVLLLGELKQLYSNILEAGSATGIGLVICWPKQDAALFSDMLRRRVPQALIILAYYCVVLDIAGNRWYLDGWPARLLQHVLASLDERWKTWIEWPVQVVLMKDGQASTVGAPVPNDRSTLLM